MQHLKLILSAVILSGLALAGLQAQEAIAATGGDASGSGGSVSYTVGQLVYQNHTGPDGSLEEGVQKPRESWVVTAIKEAKGFTLSVSVNPNPTTDYLQINVESENLEGLQYQLFDMNGKLLQNGKITSNQTSMAMGHLLPATYFLKVIVKTKGIAPQQEVKTFKIMKN